VAELSYEEKLKKTRKKINQVSGKRDKVEATFVEAGSIYNPWELWPLRHHLQDLDRELRNLRKLEAWYVDAIAAEAWQTEGDPADDIVLVEVD